MKRSGKKKAPSNLKGAPAHKTNAGKTTGSARRRASGKKARSQITLRITLLDDVIVSADAATASQHESLDYLPGRLLLGVAASKLYAKISKPQAWQLFHSGQVRFGNGYILNAENQPGWPIPQSLHYYKSGPAWQQDGMLIAQALVRAGKDKFSAQQPKPLRDGYLSVNGRRQEVDKRRSMKTAIDADSGRAGEAQLFGYEALARGQQFIASIYLPDELDKSLIDQLIAELTGEQRMGRSRSAQYGRVMIEVLNHPVAPPQSAARVGDTELTLWCLSELALVCPETGQPLLQPTPKLFDLEGGEFCSERSAIRHHRLSCFNGYRRHFDREQVVISPGSVIHLKGIEPLTETQLEKLAAGVGGCQEVGFGQLALSPPLLCRDELKFESAQPLHKSDRIRQALIRKPAASPLIEWLEAQQAEQPADFTGWVAEMRVQLERCFQKARRINGIDPALEIGPSASQWGAVGQQARNLRPEPEALMASLFGSTDAVCRQRAGSDNSWDLIVGFDAGNNEQPLSQWLKERCSEQSPDAIARLAAEMRTAGRHRVERRQGGAQ